MKSTITRIPLVCRIADGELTSSHESERVNIIRDTWKLQIDDGERVVIETGDFEHEGEQYRVEAESSLDGGDWMTWERTDSVLESPVIAGPTKMEIELRAFPPGMGTAAKSSTSSGTIATRGRPDPAA